MKTKTLMTMALLVTAALAVPALAQPDGHGRPDDAGRPGDAGGDHNATHNATDNRTDRPDRDERRGPPAHVMERIEARCDAAENESGHRPAACDRLAEIHSGAHQARRAAHAGMQAIDAWEHLNATLAMLEEKFEDKLAQENLTANQTAAYEAKLERIDAMQENLTAKMAAMEEKLAGMKERWQEVRDHVDERRAARGGHGADDASDEEEAEDESEEESEDESGEDGNETADP